LTPNFSKSKTNIVKAQSSLFEQYTHMSSFVIFNKPFRVLSQFRASGNKVTLSRYFDQPDLRVAGRLDYDSEGLLLLSNKGSLIHQITDPDHRMEKTYLAQVDGEPTAETLISLRDGLILKDGITRPAVVRQVEEPEGLWLRDPPIRFRANIATSWLELTITEGRNRQVRRMTAAVGHPTLRLIRIKVGSWDLDGLLPGDIRTAEVSN
jgi:23S rRNA pseudouridine2457 synthase